MSTINLREILDIAEHESARHLHFYVGVEHLFIALTKLDNGLTNVVLEQCSMEPRFLRYSVRQVIGVGEERRYWSGFRQTPRAQKVLEIAQRYAGIHNPAERDVLLAILDEGDSIPTRVMREAGTDMAYLRRTAANWSSRLRSEMPKVPIQSDVELVEDEQAVLQRMFRAYERIVVERELGGSYTGARLLVVQPHRAHRTEARVVVKIDQVPAILHEKRHYDSYVKDTLPPTTARLLDNPALPDECPLGGLKYTLVQPSGGTNPIDLRDYVSQLSNIELGNVIRTGIYDAYKASWWLQRQRYRFGVWREYEHVLPAALEIEVEPSATRADLQIEPLGTWSRRTDFGEGEQVELRGFIVQKVRKYQGSMQLAAGNGPEAVNRASKVEVWGLDEAVNNYRPGDFIESLVGRVSRTRYDILQAQLETLHPHFDTQMPMLPQPVSQLPNPVFQIESLLEKRLSGYLSIIHGDLHLGNVLVGPSNDAWLIDFGLTREGHTLFDWAVLEISLLATAIAPHMPPGWDGVWGTIRLLDAVNHHQLRSYRHDNPVAEALDVIRVVREIVQENLARSEDWSEYYTALALVALRGLSWEHTASVDVRRLLFLASALAIDAANRAQASPLGSDMTRDATPEVGSRPRPLSSID